MKESRLLLFVRLLQSADVHFDHLQHGLHDPLRFRGVLPAQDFGQKGGNDLP